MSAQVRLPELRRLAGLRERRAELALVEVVAAQRAVAAATAMLARRDEQLAAHDRAERKLADWLAETAVRDARLVEAALARRGAIVRARVEDVPAREEAAAALEAAQAERTQAMAALARAQGRRDAAACQLTTALGLRDRAVEAAIEAEFEDRRRPSEARP